MKNQYCLTEDQLDVQALAKEFADKTVAETVTELDLAHEFPVEEVKICQLEIGRASCRERV